MLSDNWRFVLAGACLGLAALSGQAQESQEQPKTAPGEQVGAPQQLPVPLPVVVTESVEAAISRQRAEEEATQRERMDLVAQQGMNSATQWMAKYALVQTMLVLVGTIALIWTLLETRQMTTATRDIGQRQVRAYIAVRKSRFRISREGHFMAVLEVENVGQSPAIVTELSITLEASYINGQQIEGGMIDSYRPQRGIAAGSKEYFPASFSLEIPGIENGVEEVFAVSIKGIVRWTDVFRKPDQITFQASSLNPIEFFLEHKENVLIGELQVYERRESY